MTYFWPESNEYINQETETAENVGNIWGIGLQINQAENAIYSIVTFYSLQALFWGTSIYPLHHRKQ